MLCMFKNYPSQHLMTSEFSRDLEKDLMNETSGHFRRLCVSLVQGNRVEGQAVNLDKAKRDAQVRYIYCGSSD